MQGFEGGSSGAHALKLRRLFWIVLKFSTVVYKCLNQIIGEFQLSKMKKDIFYGLLTKCIVFLTHPVTTKLLK